MPSTAIASSAKKSLAELWANLFPLKCTAAVSEYTKQAINRHCFFCEKISR
jgi:hypothetical protein